LQIKQQIEAIEKRSTDYYKNNITDLETQLRIQKLILQGKYEEAEQARIIADL